MSPSIQTSDFGGRNATRRPSRNGPPAFSRSPERVGSRTVSLGSEAPEAEEAGAGEGECAFWAGDESRMRFTRFGCSPVDLSE